MKQKKVLSDRLDFLSLILYEYDDSERKQLGPFRWQLCSGETLSNIEKWLKSDEFPNGESSESIITKLGHDRIGTDEPQIIDEFICPRVRDTLIITIGWPPGAEPSAEVCIAREQSQKVQVYQPQF